MTQIGVLLAALLVALLTFAGTAGAQTESAVLDANVQHQDGDYWIMQLHYPTVQTFVAENTGHLTDVEVVISLESEEGQESKLLTAQIVEIPTPLEGHPEVLAETSTTSPHITAGVLNPNWGSQMVTFDAPAHVEAGKTYGLLLQASSLSYWRLASISTDVYSQGHLYYLVEHNDKYWQEYTNPETPDAVFSIYVVPDPIVPATKKQCKDFGYEDFGFENQGQCIKYINTE